MALTRKISHPYPEPDPEKPKGIPLPIIAGAVAVVALIAVIILFAVFYISAGKGMDYKPNGIAVIPVKGEIFSGADQYDGRLSSEEIVDIIDQADNDPSISVILLDIDSPGGEVVASKQIVYKILEAKKPVYSYINSLGASGAYYSASASDYIMADEDSITGSIGVISIFPNFQGLLQQLGIKVTILKEGKFKASGSEFKDFTPEEQKMWQKLLSETYQQFKSDVLEFRGGRLTEQELNAVADGRILSGRQALQANLVDELLPKTSLYKRIGAREGIENPDPVYYGEKSFNISTLFMDSGRAFGLGLKSSLESGQGSMQFK